MNLTRKLHAALLLAGVFSAAFLTVFLAVALTQSAYSMPSKYVLAVDGMTITLGPPPNSTNIPLDTTIIVDALNSAEISSLHITPELPIARVTIENSGTLSSLRTFYPAQQLKTDTTYHVSATIMDKPVEWSFTTTSEPFKPRTSFYLATHAVWIALLTAVAATAVAGFIAWHKRKQS